MYKYKFLLLYVCRIQYTICELYKNFEVALFISEPNG